MVFSFDLIKTDVKQLIFERKMSIRNPDNQPRNGETIKKCVHCSDEMVARLLKSHISEKHHEKCNYCFERMLFSEMQDHVNRMHAVCRYCGVRMHQSILEAHKQNSHGNRRRTPKKIDQDSTSVENSNK